MKHFFSRTMLVLFLSMFVFTSCENKGEHTHNEKHNHWNKDDLKAVKAAILDYVEGLYEVDSTRIDKSVDVNLRKLGYYYGKDKKWRDNLPMTQKQLSSLAARWNKKGDRVNDKTPKKIEIYDVSSKTATAKLTAAWGIDYFHLGKYNGQWKIINVIWQSIPEEE